MSTDNNNSDNLMREILFIVFSQQRLIIQTIIIIFVVVVTVSFLAPKKYLGQASLLVKGKSVQRDPQIIEQIRDRRLPITHEDLNSELQILTSTAVIKRSVIKLSQQYALFDIDLKAIENSNTTQLEYAPLSRAIKKIRSSLDVSVVPSSKVLNITFRWHSATQAKQILEVLVAEYFNYRNTVFKPKKIREFYDQTVNTYQQSIDLQHKKLFTIIEKIKAPSVHKEVETNLNLTKDYSSRLGQLEQQRLAKEAEVNLLIKQLSRVDATQFNVQDVQLFSHLNRLSIRELATAVQKELAVHRNIRKHFTAKSSKAMAAIDNLQKSYRILVKEVESISQQKQGELIALEQSIAFLQQQIVNVDLRNTDLAKLQLELERITRDKDLLEQSFANYYKLREETYMQERTQSASLNTQVVLLTPVWADQSAVFPNKRLLIPFGFIIAILVGLTAGFIKEYFDDSLKRPSDSNRFIGVPVIISFTDLNPVQRQSLFYQLWLLLKKRLLLATKIIVERIKQTKGTTLVVLALIVLALVILMIALLLNSDKSSNTNPVKNGNQQQNKTVINKTSPIVQLPKPKSQLQSKPQPQQQPLKQQQQKEKLKTKHIPVLQPVQVKAKPPILTVNIPAVRLGVFTNKAKLAILEEKLNKAGFTTLIRASVNRSSLFIIYAGINLSEQQLKEAMPRLKTLSGMQGKLTSVTVSQPNQGFTP